MNIENYLTQSARAIREGNAATEVAITPKYVKAGIFKKNSNRPQAALDALVMQTLHEFINTNTGSCYPTQSKLADMIGYSRQSVNVSLSRLQAMGLIHIIPAKCWGRNGKLEDTSREIIITPFAKINDESYHRELQAEIDRVKYIIVGYNGDSSIRQIMGTGDNTDSRTREEMSAIGQETRQSKKIETLYAEARNEIVVDEEEVRKEWHYMEDKDIDIVLAAVKEVGRYTPGMAKIFQYFYESQQKKAEESGTTNIAMKEFRADFENYLEHYGSREGGGH